MDPLSIYSLVFLFRKTFLGNGETPGKECFSFNRPYAVCIQISRASAFQILDDYTQERKKNPSYGL